MPITILDVIVIVVVLISAVLAMVRGFVREVLSVASWVVAAVAAYLLYPNLVPIVQPYIDNNTVATIIAAAVIFFIALIVASYITMKISDFVIDSRIGAIDRAFGFVFGAIRGVLLLVIALWFFKFLVPNPPSWVADARSKPFLDNLGDRLIAALPEDAEARLLGRLRGGGSEESETPALPNDSAGESPQDDPAYDDSERSGIDQLIESTGDN